MNEPPIIDHDPNEPRRQTTGETVFVTVVTAATLTGLGFAIRYVFDHIGFAAGLTFCGVGTLIAFGIALAMERRK